MTASTPCWRTIYTRHVTFLYFVTFMGYSYRIFKPLAVYGDGNINDDHWVVWVKFGLLGMVGGFIPLFIPRPFVPTVSTISPSAFYMCLMTQQPSQSDPSPQQTASYISILFFSYLDSLIFKAFRVPHLGLDELPVLQAQDSSAVLSAKAFPVRYDVPVFILWLDITYLLLI